MKRLLFLLLLFSSSFFAKANHIVGGELFYNHIGGDTFQIVFELYRNCTASCDQCAPYSNPIYIQLFDTAGHYLDTISLPLPAPYQLTLNNSANCNLIDICVEAAFYQRTVVLPPIAGGYILVYQRCCRINSSTNTVPNSGATYFATIPGDTAVVMHNSRPQFIAPTPQLAGIDTPFSYTFTASDLDGDSLAYRLTYSYDGADITCVDPSPGNAGQPGCSDTASPPPYHSVTYVAPYTYLNPTNNPSDAGDLRIDPVTGILSGRVNQSGTYLIAVAVDEFRSGVLLGTTLLDYTFTFTNCIPASAIKEIVSTPAKIFSRGDELIVSFEEGAAARARITCYDLQGKKIMDEEVGTASIYTRQVATPGPTAIMVKVEQQEREPQNKKIMLAQ